MAHANGRAAATFPFAAFGGRKTNNRAQPFAAREKRITHRLVDRRRCRGFLGQKTIQRAIDQTLAGFQVHGQVHDAKDRILQDWVRRIDPQITQINAD